MVSAAVRVWRKSKGLPYYNHPLGLRLVSMTEIRKKHRIAQNQAETAVFAGGVADRINDSKFSIFKAARKQILCLA
jgi:hypothetical protein